MIKRKGLFAAILTVLLVSLLCFCLYQYDNKYTKADMQPINGVLFYEEGTDICYLTRQWLIYPDVLLTPDEADSYSGYRYYGDIGGKTSTEYDNLTYKLTLLLPSESREYAIELPEVFSTCSLYVNDKLHLQLGDPSPDSYEEGVSNQVVTFTASGKTDLLLLASDYSGVNNGLTYPPAFGNVQAVLSAREGRMLLHGMLVLLSIIGALLALSFGYRENKQKGTYSFIMFLSLAVVTGYSLYHGLFITGVQPWYTLEPLCYYALLLLALLLQGVIFNINLSHRLLLAAPCMAGLLLTLIRFSCAAILPEITVTVFSWLSACFKYYTAISLLAMSVWALWRDKCHSILLLCSSVAFAVCLVWDRLFPLYEPIYGGWFGEVGGVLMMIFLGIALWMDAVDDHHFRLTYETSFQQLEQRLSMQKEHYEQLSTQVQLARESSHDLRHHMRTMRGFLAQKQWDKLDSYLKEYETHIWEREITLWSDHLAADSVLGYYSSMFRKLNAIYDVKLVISPELPIPDADICIILSNLLENAMEAISRQSSGTRKIFLRGDSSDGRLRLVVDNTFSGEIVMKNDIFMSTKHQGPGLGISSVSTIVKKYCGLVDFYADDHVFHASILIPLSHINENIEKTVPEVTV